MYEPSGGDSVSVGAIAHSEAKTEAKEEVAYFFFFLPFAAFGAAAAFAVTLYGTVASCINLAVVCCAAMAGSAFLAAAALAMLGIVKRAAANVAAARSVALRM
jgi:hypothetical protein